MRSRQPLLRVEQLEARELPRTPFEAPTLGPPPAPGAQVVWVATEPELQTAVANLQSGQTIVVSPGTYDLTRPLYVGKNAAVQNVTIRGATDNFSDVTIRGAGMDNPAVPFGISVYNAQDVTIANLSVGGVYYHAIDLQGVQGAERVHLYHNRLFDAGEQIIKSSAGGGGVDDCVLEYNLIEFTAGPSVLDHGGGTGYTGGLHAHETDRWVIRDNLWRNFHTPDGLQHTFAPTVLMWNYSSGTLVEGNTFIDCDRAVALGLVDRTDGSDHVGGAIRNNFVYQRPGLFSEARRTESDGQLLAYDSPGTVIAHNTVLTNGNSRFSLETRWGAVEFRNNLTDAPYRGRDGGTFTESGNYTGATPDMFVNPAAGDLHLLDTAVTRALVIDRADPAFGISVDWDGAARLSGGGYDVGADEFFVALPPPPVNTAPTITAISSVTITMNGTSGPIAFTVGDAETPAGALVVTVTSSNPSLFPPSGLILGGSGADRTLTLVPARKKSGTATITLTVTDAAGATTTTSFVVTVTRSKR